MDDRSLRRVGFVVKWIVRSLFEPLFFLSLRYIKFGNALANAAEQQRANDMVDGDGSEDQRISRNI